MQNQTINWDTEFSNTFWKRWFEEYLPTLTNPSAEYSPTTSPLSTAKKSSPSEVIQSFLRQYQTGLTSDDLKNIFNYIFNQCMELMLKKNHDYGNSWQRDRKESITDTIRHKLDRIVNLETLERNGSEPMIAEGVIAELVDIINYSIFRMIKEELD